MKNQIRTIDLINYFETRVNRFIELRDIEQEKYNVAEIEFNNTIWHKWFNTPYSRNCRFSEWSDLYYSRMWIREASEILNQLEYRRKCEYETTFWEWEEMGWKSSQFYNWCLENNIPY